MVFGKALFIIFLVSPSAWASGGSSFPWWGLVNFIVVVGGIFYFVRKPALAFVQTRSKDLKTAVDEAEELRKNAEDMVISYQKKLDELDHEIEVILDRAKEDGESERGRILDRAEKAANRIREDARFAVEKEMNRARDRIRQEVVVLAVDEAKGILKQKIDEGMHEVFINELIAKLEAKDHGHA